MVVDMFSFSREYGSGYFKMTEQLKKSEAIQLIIELLWGGLLNIPLNYPIQPGNGC